MRKKFSGIKYEEKLDYLSRRFGLVGPKSEALLRDPESIYVIEEGYNFEILGNPINPMITSKGMVGIESIVLELANELAP